MKAAREPRNEARNMITEKVPKGEETEDKDTTTWSGPVIVVLSVQILHAMTRVIGVNGSIALFLRITFHDVNKSRRVNLSRNVRASLRVSRSVTRFFV